LANQPTFEQLVQSLKSGKYAPVYYLFGEEHFYIDQISDLIEKTVLDEASKGFNQTILYGRDVDVQTLVSSARRFPMMAPFQVIIVKEAQHMKMNEAIEPYLEKPVPTTILVLCSKSAKLDKRTRFYKLLDKHIVFESKKLNQDKIAGWIVAYLKQKGYQITAKASNLIAESLGNDLSKVVNELEKLIINKEGNTEITDTDVELKIGISREFNIFELINSLSNKNASRVFHIAHHLSKAKDFSIIPCISNLSTFFNRTYLVKQSKTTDSRKLQTELGLNYYQSIDCANASRHFSLEEIERSIRLLHEYDLKSKGVNNVYSNQEQLFKELLLKIL
jgi:DNA polymerase-3 subunit delta